MTDKKRYWSTLEEYYRDMQVERLRGEEFYSKPETAFTADQGPQKFDRREFMKLGGAAMVLAMVACSERPAEKIVPYVRQPEGAVPGVPRFYASTCGDCPAACGTVVKTREGRPIKMEGNPDHAVNVGKLCARGQASLLNLYDPGRLRYPVKKDPSGQWRQAAFADLDRELVAKLKQTTGEVVLLTGMWHGPARVRLVENFLGAFRSARHVRYEALVDDGYVRSRESAFGTEALPQYHLDRAELLVLIGSDLFGNGRSRVQYIRDFAARRKLVDGRMSKVFAFEPALSEIGSKADERYLVRPSQLYKIAAALVNQMVVAERRSAYATDPAVVDAYSEYAPEQVESELDLPHGLIARLAAELWEQRGKCLVVSEGFSNQSEFADQLHLSVHLLNSILESEGATIETDSIPSSHLCSSYEELRKLALDMAAGKIGAILISGPNPLYSLPAEFGFSEGLKQVPLRISLADRIDETADHCDYVLPSLHHAESWGDSEPLKGYYGIQQPTITPLWENRQTEDTLVALGAGLGHAAFLVEGKPTTWYECLRRHWRDVIYAPAAMIGSFEEFWIAVLQKGFFQTQQYGSIRPKGEPFRSAALAGWMRPGRAPEGYELVLTSSSMHWDGRSMNNAWLLETPDPISRITWDNYVSVAPATAGELGVLEGDLVKVRLTDREIEIPVHVAPGVHPQVLAIQVGWGRSKVGEVGNGVGANAFALTAAAGPHLHFSRTGASVAKTGKQTRLACTQGHNYLEQRPILYETTLDEFRQDPHAGQHKHQFEDGTMWKEEHHYPGHKWGLAIDLNSCVGCNACMTACQVENNVPVVGKEQVLIGREMHWIRIDRYFSGKLDNPEVVHQPMLCQQCDNAPCETVCPVVATMHNDEGLNLQVYNRCVGTRYCSNNCPYKVRRFNFFNFSGEAYKESPLQMLLNPDVTVRSRGVMEKCTFCIQRIKDAHHEAKAKGRPIADGEVVTACAQTCPAQALVFGDLNDPDSAVSKVAKQERGFKVLSELNTRPSVTYLTLVRNRAKREEEHEQPGI